MKELPHMFPSVQSFAVRLTGHIVRTFTLMTLRRAYMSLQSENYQSHSFVF